MPSPTTAYASKRYLEDVVVLRLFFIFFLLWDHVFAPYAGNWDEIPNQENITVYYWFVSLMFHLQFQGLIFISGYLLGYASKRVPQTLEFNNCVLKKVKRLLLPSVIFSILYFMLFYDTTQSMPAIAYSIINGCGHMWYLPMLFWCFVGVFLVEKLNIKPWVVIGLAVLLALLPLPALPLRLTSVCKYFIFFYLGFGIQRSYFKNLTPNNSLKPILICIGIYFSAYIVYYLLFQYIQQYTEGLIYSISLSGNLSEMVISAAKVFLYNILALIMSSSGVLAAFWSAHYFIVGKYKLPDWLIKLSTYCYGVYICQQFILLWLYYHTSLPYMVSSAVLPWIALMITLGLSLLITHLLLKTRTGRFLIG